MLAKYSFYYRFNAHLSKMMISIYTVKPGKAYSPLSNIYGLAQWVVIFYSNQHYDDDML